MVVGCLADVVEDQFARLFKELGIENVHFFPPRKSTDLPPIGENTHFLLAQPFLADTARVLQNRGAKYIPAHFPLGEEGTTLWLKAAARQFGIDKARIEAVIAAPRERAKKALGRSQGKARRQEDLLLPQLAA